MPRLMSVALTEEAVLLRLKTETRRLGWSFLKPGDHLTLCRKVMGRKRPDGSVEPLLRLADVRVVEVRQESLDHITDDAVDREGFGPWQAIGRDDAAAVYDSPALGWWPPGTVPPQAGYHGPASERFIDFFTEAMNCPRDQQVTVIRWEYL